VVEKYFYPTKEYSNAISLYDRISMNRPGTNHRDTSHQWRNWREGKGGEPPPWQAKCKNWAPFTWHFDI